MSKNAVIFDPYLDTLGGGERYCLTVAHALHQLNWSVDIAWNNPKDIEGAQTRFNMDFGYLRLNKQIYNLFTQKSTVADRYKALSNFGLVFVVSDGSIPILFGGKKFLHYQVPFTHINQNPLINKIKLLTVDKIVTNSQFTQKVINHTLGTNKSVVVYPPVDVQGFNPNTPKKNQILSVGRFASPSHPKRQEVLIEAFRQLIEGGLTGWKLILAGGQKGNDHIVDELKKQAGSLPVEIYANPPFEKLRDLYNESCIYWHAAGYQIDETINPESVEHFGITTVEAMAAGNVPVVIARGGQKEIITSQTGFLAENIDEIAKNTHKLINDKKLWSEMAQEAVIRAKDFSLDHFVSNFQALLQE